MKARIYGRAEFALELSQAQITVLETCSGAHYDARCKAASERGGFIYGWQNSARFHYANEAENPTGEPLRVHATFNELDTCAKILECAGHLFFGTDEGNTRSRTMARDMAASFSKLMYSANELTPGWSKDTEV